MIDKIIKAYEAQARLYNEIYDTLKSSAGKKQSDYMAAFEKVVNVMNKIDNINNDINILKNEYVKIKEMHDFSGKEIAMVEKKEKYLELKNIIEDLNEKIKLVKKFQDNIIASLNKQTFEVSKISNNSLKIYKERIRENESLHKITYFDITK